MPTNLPAWPGTISIAANSTAVVGTGTAFTTAAQGAVIIAQLSSGAGVFVGQFAADPTDDTHATLMLAPKSAISGASYVLVPVSGAVAQAQRVRTALETLAALPTTAGQIAAATETALVDADKMPFLQAASGNLFIRTWANFKAQLVAAYTTLATASQTQAQAGTDNTTGMTPLRTAQAIVAQALRLDGSVPMTGLLTTNGQVAFPATQNQSSGANVLDDYEEGSNTPILAFGGASTGITYAANAATYVKVGRFCHNQGLIQLTSKGSATGSNTIGGQPFPLSGTASVTLGRTTGTVSMSTPQAYANTSSGIVPENAGAAGAATMNDGNYTDTTNLFWAAHLQAAA